MDKMMTVEPVDDGVDAVAETVRSAVAETVRDAIYDDDIAAVVQATGDNPIAFTVALAVVRAASGAIPADDDGMGLGRAAESARQAILKADWRAIIRATAIRP